MTDLIKPAEAAKRLGITSRMLHDLVRAGEIAFIQIGLGKLRPRVAFSPDDIEKFIERKRVRLSPPTGRSTVNVKHAEGQGFMAMRESFRREEKK